MTFHDLRCHIAQLSHPEVAQVSHRQERILVS
jgi:hypothetical protein